MDDTISQIERDLAAERAELGRNLHALEAKARQMTDWRHHYRNHPWQLLGAALATGVVLGVVAGGSASNRAPEQTDLTTSSYPAVPRSRNRAFRRLEQDWHHISDALMGVASAKVMEFVGNLVPGFQDALHRDSRS